MPRSLVVALLILGACAPVASAVVPGPPQSQRDPYEIFTIGDSFAAGEGAPDTDGQYNDDGDLTGAVEDWDNRITGSPADPGLKQDTTRCHRSGRTSPSAVARQLFADEFPDIVFNWKSVACSGASIVQTAKLDGSVPPRKGGILRGYDGAENLSKRGISSGQLSPEVFPPQLIQLNTILDGRPPGPTKRINALVMNLGGNDAGFAELIAKCYNILPAGDCHTDAEVATFLSAKLGLLNGRFNRLAASLNDAPATGSGDPGLDYRPADVFLTAGPNPLRATATTFCDRQPPGNYEENLIGAESEWLEANVLIPLNTRFQTEANQHGWNLVTSHVDKFFGHGLCAPDNWINTNLQALRKQGELDETENLPIAVSGGIGHPNRNGFAAIGSALYARMRPFIMDRYTPDAAPRVTTLSSATGFGVTVGDDNLTALRSGYWHRVKLRQLNADGTITNVTGADRLRELGYGTGSVDYVRTGRYFVTALACGPLSRDATKGCGPVSSELRVSTFVPARPVNLAVVGGDAPAAVMPTPGFSVSWEHADQFALHDTRRSVVRVRRKDNGSVVQTQTVEGRFTSTVIKGLATGVPYLVSVKACNDRDRCSSFTAELERQAQSGQEPFSGLFFELQRIELAIRGAPCSTTPVRFDPALGPETPGFEGPVQTFQPSCPEDLPIGRLALAREVLSARAGRPVKVELRWRHPSRWRSLHEVTVRLGSLATLRFDQDADRVTLARRSRAKGRSLPAGRAGRLAAGRVKVLLAKNAVKGSGPRGRSVRLRFRVVLPRSARPNVVLAIGASDDTGQVQGPVPGGLIRVR